jgi:hypothetical protein
VTLVVLPTLSRQALGQRHLTYTIARVCINIFRCASDRKASVVPQALAGLGGFFTLLNASWLCLTNLAAVVVTIPILVLVLLPSCIGVGRGVYISVAVLCLVNVVLEILSSLCDVSVRPKCDVIGVTPRPACQSSITSFRSLTWPTSTSSQGTIYDVISATCFFLAACTCLCIAMTLRSGSVALSVLATATGTGVHPDSTHSIVPELDAPPMPQRAAFGAPHLPAPGGTATGSGENGATTVRPDSSTLNTPNE